MSTIPKRPGNVGPAYLSRGTGLRKWHTHTLPPPRPPKICWGHLSGIHPRSKPYLAFLHPALQKVLFLQLVPFQVGGKCIFEGKPTKSWKLIVGIIRTIWILGYSWNIHGNSLLELLEYWNVRLIVIVSYFLLQRWQSNLCSPCSSRT